MSDTKIATQIWPENYEVTGHTDGFLIHWIPLDSDELENTLSDTIPDWLDEDQIFVYREDFAHAMDIQVKELTKAQTGYLVVALQQQDQDAREAVEVVLSDESGYVTIKKGNLKSTKFPAVRVAHLKTKLQPDTPHLLEVVLRKRE